MTKTDSTLTVNQAVATVAANAKSKFYGDGESGADAVVTGAVGGDDAQLQLATTALTTVAAWAATRLR